MWPFLLAYLRLRRTQAWLLLLTALAVVLAFTPLFNLLGYEFCLALTIVASVAAAHLASAASTMVRELEAGELMSLGRPLGTLVALVGRCTVGGWLLLLPPLALISLNALRVKNCDYVGGLAFFAMMPVLSVVLASAVGVLWSATLPRHPRLATAASLLTLLASVLWGLWRFYDAPPIFGYDPFVGYFPGSLYDEDVTIRTPFFVYRVYNLAWLAAALLTAAHLFDPTLLRLRLRRLRPRRQLTPAALVALSAALALFALRAPLGFCIDGEHIAGALGGVHRTTHFTIYHPRSLTRQQVELLGQDHEFRYAQLSTFFGRTPRQITSFIFQSSEQKRRLMGAGRVFIAKPWRREVYLQRAGFPHRVLKHELAHIFAGTYGDHLFGVSLRWQLSPLPHPVFNVGLIEGVAVAADWRPYLEEMNGHQMAAALVRLGLAPPLSRLFGYGFLTGAASRAYTLAGSFCRFLHQRHGAAKLGQVFHSGGQFKRVYGRSLAQLLRDWSSFIAQVQLSTSALQLARERFRRPSILRRVCGHEVARLVAESDEQRSRGQPAQAAHTLRRVCAFEPDEPLHLLRLMEATAEDEQLPEAIGVADRLLAHPKLSAPLRRTALMRRADLRWLLERREQAANDYEAAAALAATAGDRRVLHLKRWALDQPADVRRLVRRYLVPPPGTPREAGLDVHLAHRLYERLPGSGLGQFLVAKQLRIKGHYRDAARAASRALELGLPNRDFRIDARLLLAECLYGSARYRQIPGALEPLLADRALAAGTKLQANDWLQRAAWRTGDALGDRPLAH